MPILGGFGAGSARGYGQRGTAKGLINATGGTITCCGDYRIHTFTGPGTFEVQCINACVPAPTQKVDYVIVAGGGGGSSSPHGGGGAGAGGFRESHCGTISGCYTASPLATPASIPISGSTSYPVVVGSGGAASPRSDNCVPQGGGSSAFGISSTGGGAGGQSGIPGPQWAAGPGGTGGSGGGGGGVGGSFSTPSGSGNNPPTSPPQGNPGGSGTNASGDWGGAGGGGGGATQSGTGAFSTYDPGNGGDGAGTAMNPEQGTPGPTPGVRYFAGGGGGKTQAPPQPVPWQGEGGAGGGGGQPGYLPCGQSTPFAENPEGWLPVGDDGTGGGAWGAGNTGAAGIVMIRYKYK